MQYAMVLCGILFTYEIVTVLKRLCIKGQNICHCDKQTFNTKEKVIKPNEFNITKYNSI